MWAARAVPGRTPAALDFSDDGDAWVKHLVHVSVQPAVGGLHAIGLGQNWQCCCDEHVPPSLYSSVHSPLLPPQVRETDSYHVAKVAKIDDETGEDILVLLPTVEGGGSRCHMRSLGYMGSFLLAYSSAQVGGRTAGLPCGGAGRRIPS